MKDLAALEAAVVECRRCPRLVAWREQVAAEIHASVSSRPSPAWSDSGWFA